MDKIDRICFILKLVTIAIWTIFIIIQYAHIQNMNEFSKTMEQVIQNKISLR